jgi:hypothetical protein
MGRAAESGFAEPAYDEHAHPDNQARTLASSILRQVRSSGSSWLFVFDGIDRPTLTPEAFRLIETIAVDAATRVDTPLKVAILGYDNLLPDGAEAAAIREVIGPIDRPEIQKCLEDTAVHLSVPVTQEAIDAALERILPGGPAARPELCEIAEALLREAQTIFAVQADGG